MNRDLLLGAAIALLAGCNTGTSACGAPPSIAGTWAYTGTQSNPTANLTGTLTLTRTGTCTVSGTLMLTIDNGIGTPGTTSWPTSGDFLDDSILELNADSAGGAERHHLGTLRADTIAGPWSMTSGGANGTFKAVRSTP